MSVSRASGKITNISHVCEVELSPRISSITRTFNSGFPLVREIHEVPLDLPPVRVFFSPPHGFVSLFSGARGAMLRAATWPALFRAVDCRARFANPSDFEHRNRSRTHGRPAAVRLKRHSNTVPGPQVPAGAGRRKHQQERGLKGPWVGGWWHGRVGRVRAGWCARRGREGDAWRGAGCEGGGGWFTRGCSPRGPVHNLNNGG